MNESAGPVIQAVLPLCHFITSYYIWHLGVRSGEEFSPSLVHQLCPELVRVAGTKFLELVSSVMVSSVWVPGTLF